MPPELVPKLRYYNVPARAEPGHKLHPWRLLAASPMKLTALDYVVVKFDGMCEMATRPRLAQDGCGSARRRRPGLPRGSASVAKSA